MYDLGPFRFLAKAFVKFRDSALAFQTWLEGDEDSVFVELLSAARRNKADFEVMREQISEDQQEHFKEKLREIKFQEMREFGEEIVTLLEGVEAKWDQHTYTARMLCISVAGHTYELFNDPKKESETSPHTKFKLLGWVGIEHKGPDKLFDLFSKVLSNICSLIQSTTTPSVESPEGLAARCIELHVGKDAAKITAKNRLLRHQLNTIQWKDYVRGDAKYGRKTAPAIELLTKLSKNKNKPIIQIIGEGGLGKTKLTIEFIKNSLDDEDLIFDSVLMLTAKSDLQGEWNTSFSGFRNQEAVLSPRDPTLAFGHYVPDMDFEIVMDYIYDLVDIEKHKHDFLLRELQKSKHLIVLDNFEDASEEMANKFFDFFDDVEQLENFHSKFIITGRTMHEHAHTYDNLELLRLSDSQALELMLKKYEFEYRRYYSDQQSGKRVQIFDDFKKAINKNLIPSIKQSIEAIDQEIARYFDDGVLHPGVLFYFISMLMDGELYNDYVREKGISPTFAVLFEYAVCHKEYGIPTYISEWDKWIKDKTTKYIQNDPVCLEILKWMSQHPQSFFDVISLMDAIDAEKPTLSAAYAKLSSHDGILEINLETGKHRISSDAIMRFNLRDSESLAGGLVQKLRPIFEDLDSLTTNLPILIPDWKKTDPIMLNDFSLLVECTHKLRDANRMETFRKCRDKLQSLFDGVYSLAIPSEAWTVQELRALVSSQNKHKPHDLLKEQWLGEAKAVFSSIEDDFSSIPAKMQNRIKELPRFFIQNLSLSESLDELNMKMSDHRVPLIHGFRPDMRFVNMLEDVTRDWGETQEIHNLIHFIVLLSENYDYLKSPSSRVLNAIPNFLTFSTKENVNQDLLNLGVHNTDRQRILDEIEKLLNHPGVRLNIDATLRSLEMMEFFESVPVLEAQYGMQSILDQSLPFIEIKFTDDFPSLSGAMEETAEITCQGDDGTIHKDCDHRMRCIFVKSIPILQQYRFLQVPMKSTITESSMPQVPEDSVSDSEISIDFNELIVNHINGIRPLRRYIDELVQGLSEKHPLPPQGGWSGYIVDHLRTILEVVNKDRDPSDQWDLMISLSGKTLIGIERQPQSATGLAHNHYLTKSTLQPQARSTAPSPSVKAWFERKKQGVWSNTTMAIADIDELLPRLIEFHKEQHIAGISPVDFATSFVKTFSRPYSEHRRTSMRFYAAFRAATKTKPPSHRDILDAYEREFRRQLMQEQLSNTSKAQILQFCESWLQELRSHYNLPSESYIERNRRQGRLRQQQKESNRKARIEARKIRQEEERKRREEKRRMEEERRKADEALAAERQRSRNVRELIGVLKGRPSEMADDINLVEFYNALIKISEQSVTHWTTIAASSSKLISTFYKTPDCHAILCARKDYMQMLWKLEVILDNVGIEGLPRQVDEPTLWPLMAELLREVGFTENEMGELKMLIPR